MCSLFLQQCFCVDRSAGVLSAQRRGAVPRLCHVRGAPLLRLQRPVYPLLRLPSHLHRLLPPTAHSVVAPQGHRLALSAIRDPAADPRTGALPPSQVVAVKTF